MTFSYCPRCGGSLKSQSSHGELVSTCQEIHCGFRLFGSSKPCATLIIENDLGQVLMTRRHHDPDRGKLDFPGGFLREGEHPVVGARREGREELSADVVLTDCLGFVVDTYHYQGVTSSTLNIGFLATVTSDALTAADDAASLEWIDPQTVDPDELAFRNNTVFLNKLLQRRQGQETLLN